MAGDKAQRALDTAVAALCEAALIGLAGLAGWLVHAPLLFASLGPTAYELVETPERRSARPYNVIAGHLVGVLAALGAVRVTRADQWASVSMGGAPIARIGAAALACAVTVLVTLAIEAAQPAAIASALLIALGLMPGWRGGGEIMAAVVLVTIFGEPVRIWRLRVKRKTEEAPAPKS